MDSTSGKAASTAPEPRARRTPCWIESFIDETSAIPSPEIFRRWSAITAVAGALERRVWVTTAESSIYANLFVLLVSPPGVGKTQAIKRISELWQRTQRIKVAPDDVSKASLLDALAASRQTYLVSPTEILTYHSLSVAADELGVLLPAHDLSFMSVMNKLFDNVSLYRETRRGRPDDDLDMENPQATLLAGTQPDFLAGLLPPEAWGMGFMSRMIMVYEGTAVKTQLFGTKRQANTKVLLEDLKAIAQLYGEMGFTEEARDEIVRWHNAGLAPAPQHLKLKHYVQRRILNFLKLCMVSSVSRNSSMMIEMEDVERARVWLLEAERTMPEIFKDMSGKSDRDVIQDLHGYVWQIYMAPDATGAPGKKPIHLSRLHAFLQNRTPAYNIPHLIKTCVAGGILKEYNIDLFIPGAQTETGWE